MRLIPTTLTVAAAVLLALATPAAAEQSGGVNGRPGTNPGTNPGTTNRGGPDAPGMQQQRQFQPGPVNPGTTPNQPPYQRDDGRAYVPPSTLQQRPIQPPIDRQYRSVGSGTGFYVNRQGQIMTSFHVVANCSAIRIKAAGKQFEPATIIARDQANDLALLQASPNPAAGRLRVGTEIRAGENIVVYGFPLSSELSSTGSVTTGIVNSTAGLKDDPRYLQISAPIQPGNSGGPLLDGNGSIVGIIRAQYVGLRIQNVNFAV
ncbi:MAG: S1C family serine protease, partial [Alphaproteobacteria bacterium]